MSNFALLSEKFDKAAVAAQGAEWGRELDDEARARAALSLDAGEQLARAKKFYESNVEFVNAEHASRAQALADVKSAVEENERLAAEALAAKQELHDYLNAPERRAFAQKVLELEAMDKELHDYLLAKGRLGRPPVAPEPEAEEPEAEADPMEGMPENPLVDESLL